MSDAGEPDLRRRAPAATAARRRCARRPQPRPAIPKCWQRYAADYPQGPHDQPQSMCPAFGSLRVGLRMKRTATVLSGSACCVYGLDLHLALLRCAPFGRLRAVRLRDAGHRQAVRGHPRGGLQARRSRADYDAIVVTNLCVPTASGVPLRLLAEGDQRRAHHRHRRAGVRHPDARRGQGRARRCDAGLRPRGGDGRPRLRRPTRVAASARRSPSSARCSRPTPSASARMLEPLGLSCRPGRADARMARALCRARLRRGRGDPSILQSLAARVRGGGPADRRLGPRRRRRHGRLARQRSAAPAASPRTRIDAAKNRFLPAIKPQRWLPNRSRVASRCPATKARSCSSPASSSRVAPTCATSARRARARPGRKPIAQWLDARGIPVTYRASLEQDLAAMECFEARPRDRHDAARAEGQGASGIPALYFTNLISARPLFGMMGAGSLARSRQHRDRLQAAFRRDEGLLRRRRLRAMPRACGKTTPVDRPEFRAKSTRSALDIKAKQKAPGSRAWRDPGSSGGRTDARPRSRQGRGLLGRSLCVHGHQGPAGRHRRPCRLRELSP